MIKLGGSITTENASQFSSATKGETLEDTIRVISNYADFIILRHYEDTIDEVTKVSNVPIINAGSGKAYHPTQTLLDTYTIESYFSSLSNLSPEAFIAACFRIWRTNRKKIYFPKICSSNELKNCKFVLVINRLQW